MNSLQKEAKCSLIIYKKGLENLLFVFWNSIRKRIKIYLFHHHIFLSLENAEFLQWHVKRNVELIDFIITLLTLFLSIKSIEEATWIIIGKMRKKRMVKGWEEIIKTIKNHHRWSFHAFCPPKFLHTMK